MRNELAWMALGLLLVSTSASAAVVCAKADKKGQIKRITLRQACVGKETSLTSKDLPPSGPLVRDANGQEIGPLDPYDGILWTQNGQSFLFYARKDGPEKLKSDFSGFYLTPDCSGQVYRERYFPSPEAADDEGANALVPYLNVSENGTKGYYYTDGAVGIDASVQTIYSGIVSYTATGTAMCGGTDAPVGAAFSCDPKLFCGGVPLAASCSCIKCCQVYYTTGQYVLTPRKSIDFPTFAAPFSVER